jgi:hypothetical protein
MKVGCEALVFVDTTKKRQLSKAHPPANKQDRTVLLLALTKQPQAKAAAIQGGPAMN